MEPKVKTEERGYIRDIRNGALLNTDNDALRVHKARRKERSVRQELEARVEHLERLVQELLQRS